MRLSSKLPQSLFLYLFLSFPPLLTFCSELSRISSLSKRPTSPFPPSGELTSDDTGIERLLRNPFADSQQIIHLPTASPHPCVFQAVPKSLLLEMGPHCKPGSGPALGQSQDGLTFPSPPCPHQLCCNRARASFRRKEARGNSCP